jgi:hypothetical protein
MNGIFGFHASWLAAEEGFLAKPRKETLKRGVPIRRTQGPAAPWSRIHSCRRQITVLALPVACSFINSRFSVLQTIVLWVG